MDNFNKQKFSELLIKAKGDRSLNQYASAANVDSGYLSRIINRKRNTPPSADIIKRLADAAQNNVTWMSLMEAAGYTNNTYDETYLNLIEDRYKDDTLIKINTKENINNSLFLSHKAKDKAIAIPIIKEIKVSDDILHETNIDGYEYIPNSSYDYAPNFCIYITDDVMANARIKNGDLAYIKEQSKFKNGDIVVAIANKQMVVRRYFSNSSIIILTADNPKYEPLVFNISELQNNKINLIGKIVHIKFNL